MSRIATPVAFLLLCCAVFAGLMPAAARADAATHITAQLVPEQAATGTPATTTLALSMTPAAGWHGYWLNPGDAGYPMRLTWHLPAGASAGAPQYPVPQTLLLAGLMNHVYERAYAVLVPFTAPAGAAAGTRLPVSLDAEWLACSASVCVPEKGHFAATVVVGPPAGAADPRFDGWRAALPAPLGGTAAFAVQGKSLRIGIPLPASVAVPAPHLFVANDGVTDAAGAQRFSRRGDTLIVDLPFSGSAAPARIDAVLGFGGGGLAIGAASGVVPADGTPLAGDSAPVLPSLPLLLLAALAGGLLLNVMPCVFPILSLKALSLARAGGHEAEARAEGLAYTGGVVLACATLGGLLLALRAGGAEVGWAFQLQDPLVVAALVALAVAITANLLGLYEFAVPGFATHGPGLAGGGGHPVANAFGTGLLAAFVATPCTGPFMASAMGAALLLPPVAAMGLFVALGVGLALPFLAIAFVPPLRRLLPRPGAWMVWFRRAMAVPMGLTALALVWLASRLAGWSFAGLAVVLAIVLLALLARLGEAQRKGWARGGRFGVLLAVLVACGAVVLPRAEHRPDAEAPDVLPTQPFSAEALAAARAGGHPVFAYFTADWCLTCKVNERVSIERTDTRDAFAKAGVVVLKGDWTRRDGAITQYLTAHGAAGVPLYVWYPAGGGAERVLPQVLTPALLAGLPSGH